MLVVSGAFVGLDAADRFERLATDADAAITSAPAATDAAAVSFTTVDANWPQAGEATLRGLIGLIGA